MTEEKAFKVKALYEKIQTLRNMTSTPEITRFAWEHDYSHVGCPDHLWASVMPELNLMFLNVVKEYLQSLEKEFEEL